MARIRRLIALAIAAIFIAPVTAADARAGDIDRSFGDDGIARAGFNFARRDFAGKDVHYGHDVAVADDGKVIAAGLARSASGRWGQAVARFRRGGGLDKRFGDGGRMVVDLDAGGPLSSYSWEHHVLPGPGKKVTLVGFTRDPTEAGGFDIQIVAVRLTSKGTLDTSFGDGGRLVVDPFPALVEGSLAGAVLLQDGSLLVAGNAWTVLCLAACNAGTASGRAFVAKYDVEGAPDTSFGIAGVALLPTTVGARAGVSWVGGVEEATFIALDVDDNGRIIIFGRRWLDPVITFVMWRFLPSGLLDPAFGNGGEVIDPCGEWCSGADVVVHEDFYYVAFDRFESGWGVARVGTDGAVDRSFADVILPGLYGRFRALAIHRDRIWLTGRAGRRTAIAARLRMNGNLDKAFGVDGLVRMPEQVYLVGQIAFRGDRAQIAARVKDAYDLVVVQLKA